MGATMTTCQVHVYIHNCGEACNCGYPVFFVETPNGEYLNGKMDGVTDAMRRKMPDCGSEAAVDFTDAEMVVCRAESVQGTGMKRTSR